MRKYILSLLFLLSICLVPHVELKADESISEQTDPDYWKMQGYNPEVFMVDDEDVIGNEPEIMLMNEGHDIMPFSDDTRTVRKGIDVSKWQGEIDWNKAKSQGVEFAIVRVGARNSYTGEIGYDTYYEKNLEGALASGIRVGVYIFSQAISEEEAVEEAEYLLARIYKYNITLPVVLDYEYLSTSSGLAGRLYQANLSKDKATSICLAFCNRVRQAGYTPMVYANKSMLMNQLDYKVLEENTRIWLANYTETTTYPGKYDFWQYSSTGDGYAHGMSSQYLDMDWWYDDGTIYGQDYSPVFDATYYANRYADIKAVYGDDVAGMLQHFITYGMSEGRQGCETFNVQSYRNAYKDLRNAFGNNWKSYYIHYLNHGIREGRVGIGYETTLVGGTTVYNGIDYSPVYDANYYVNKYRDLKNAFGYDEESLLAHFVNCGMREGRQAKETFEVYSYKGRYWDLQNAFGNNLLSYYIHYIQYGKSEKRDATYQPGKYTVTFVRDGEVLSSYVVNYGHGVANPSIGRNGITEVSFDKRFDCVTSNLKVNVDWKYVYNGLDYSDVFDEQYYLNKYADLKNAFGNDGKSAFVHFLTFGMKEGRQGSSNFNLSVYRENNLDLQNAFADDNASYYVHYLVFGKNENRIKN